MVFDPVRTLNGMERGIGTLFLPMDKTLASCGRGYVLPCAAERDKVFYPKRRALWRAGRGGKRDLARVAMPKNIRYPGKGSYLRRLISAALIVCGAVSFSVNPARGEEEMIFNIATPAFDHGQAIPARFTCQGEDVSPPLQWEGIPEGSRSLVLIVDDPDAPDPQAPKMTWVHWVLYNIPPEAKGLPEGVHGPQLPAGTAEGLNDWKRPGYGGPCPPIGRHRYFFKLYALQKTLEGLHHPTKAQVEAAMQGHVIAQTELMGTYQKSK
jgi:Raf kinase inhibitor-like YbhB/YbcL family protein